MWFSRASHWKKACSGIRRWLLGREGERLAVVLAVVVQMPPVTLQDRPGDVLGPLMPRSSHQRMKRLQGVSRSSTVWGE